MKILLINPRIAYHGNDRFPIGLGYIAGALHKHSVDVIDQNVDDRSVVEYVKKEKPNIIGISVTTPVFDSVCKLVKKIKTMSNAKIVFGGVHPTFMPDECLQCADIAVRGEGEQTICEVVDAIEHGLPLNNIKGISYSDGGKIVHSPDREFIQDLDSIKMPAYEKFKIEKYKVMSLVSSRGCPYACLYCCAAQFWHRRVRYHSVDRALAEMRLLHENFGVEKFKFHDSTFTLDKQRVVEMANRINSEMYVTWSCEVRADTLDKEMLSTMRKSGCVFIFIGVDSASLHVLGAIQRRMDVEKMEQAFVLARECNMSTKAYVAFGMPGENRDSVEETIAFLQRTKPDQIMLSLATAYPGTALYAEAMKGKNIKMPDQWLGMVGGHGRGALLYLPDTLSKDEYKQLAEYMLDEIKKIRKT